MPFLLKSSRESNFHISSSLPRPFTPMRCLLYHAKRSPAFYTAVLGYIPVGFVRKKKLLPFAEEPRRARAQRSARGLIRATLRLGLRSTSPAFTQVRTSRLSRASWGLPILLALCLLHAACAPGLHEAAATSARQLRETEARLRFVALPLLVAAADFCPHDVEPTYGFLFDQGTTEAGRTEIFIRYVHPKLPAGQAGLPVGARLLALNDRDVSQENANEVMEWVHRTSLARIQPLTLRIKDTEGRTRDLDLYAIPACKYPVLLVQSDGVNAYADGKKVAVTTGMMRYANTDAALALVVAHEIAHNAMEHSDTIRLESLLENLLVASTGNSERGPDAATARMATQEFEADADYMGLYIAARDGHDMRRAADFWRRLSAQSADSPAGSFGLRHPSAPQRFLAFERTLREIEEKKLRGKPLSPEKKPNSTSVNPQ